MTLPHPRRPRPSHVFARTTALLACLTMPARAFAQGPGVRPGDNGEPGATADSVRLLDQVAHEVRRAKHDGALWHRQGMLAWGLVYSHQRDAYLSRHDDILHLESANEGLRMAVQESPDSARFWLDLQQFLMHSATPTARRAAGSVARQAAAAAERAGDFRLASSARDGEGMRAWRQYEANSRVDNGSQGRDVAGGTLEPAEFDPRAMAEIEHSLTGDRENDFAGETQYREAETAFLEAVRLDPTSRPARRHLYMLLTERARWEQLRTTALGRATEAPDEPDAWLALGLAAHRLGDEQAATAAFDRGLGLLSDDERARFTRLTRILPPHPAAGRIDSAGYARATPRERAVMERGFWALADPLALTPVNEHRLEFYARVEYADLLWTAEELGIRGADTERGDVLVRFGMPPLVLRTGGPGVDNVTEWRYPYRRFYFSTPGGFGTGRLQSESHDIMRDFRQSLPVVWRDAPAARPDSMAVEVARFRAAGDSTAVYVSAAIPVRALAGGVARGGVSVDVGFALFDALVQPVLRDSARLRVAADDAAPVDVRAWRGTLPPGQFGYRVEGLGVASRRGARATGPIGARAGSGFGASDVLVAASIAPAAGRAERWTDFVTVPNGGEVARGAPVALLWETYGLAAGADSTSHYRVTVQVEPAVKTNAIAGFVGRVLGGVAGAVGLRGESRADGTMSIAFDRQAPARPVTVDYLTLDLGGAPPGRYVVRVTVADAIGGQSTATLGTFRVVEAAVR